MTNLIELKKRFELSYKLYKESSDERHALHEEQWKLNYGPLGEMELFCNDISGVAHSIYNGKIPREHLNLLKKISMSRIPHFDMAQKYLKIVKDIENWEKIRSLCINIIENN